MRNYMIDAFDESIKKFVAKNLKLPNIDKIIERKERFDEALLALADMHCQEEKKLKEHKESTDEKLQELEERIKKRNDEKKGFFQKISDGIQNVFDRRAINQANAEHDRLVRKSSKELKKADGDFQKIYKKYHKQALEDCKMLKKFMINLPANSALTNNNEEIQAKIPHGKHETYINDFIEDQMKKISELHDGSKASAQYFTDLRFTKEKREWRGKLINAFTSGLEKANETPEFSLVKVISRGIAENVAAQKVTEFGLRIVAKNSNLPQQAIDFLENAIDKVRHGGVKDLQECKIMMKCVRDIQRIYQEKNLSANDKLDGIFEEFHAFNKAVHEVGFDEARGRKMLEQADLIQDKKILPPPLNYTAEEMSRVPRMDLRHLPPPSRGR